MDSKKKIKKKAINIESKPIITHQKNSNLPSVWLDTLSKKINTNFNNPRTYFIVFLIFSLLFIQQRYQIRVTNSGDDIIEYRYGEATYNYFVTLGKDTTFKKLDLPDFKMQDLYNYTGKYYGMIFNAIAYGTNLFFNLKEIFTIKFIIGCIITILIGLFLSLSIKKITDSWVWATIGWLFFINTPMIIYLGFIYCNLKDIPFALGFILFFYNFINFFNNPKISQFHFKNSVGIGLAMLIATLSRIGSILLLGYILMYFLIFIVFNKTTRKDFIQNFKKILYKKAMFMIITLVIGFLLAIFSYPNFWMEGFSHITNGISAFSHFTQKIPVLFDGQVYVSTELPSNYLIKNLLITVPIFVILGFILAVLNFFNKSNNRLLLIVLFFSIFFPIVLIYLTHGVMYDKWRHITFVYPFIIIFSVVGFKYLLEFKNKLFFHIFFWLTLVFFIKTAFWNFKNFPLQTAYFNEFIGGTNGGWLQQETDPQQNGARPAFEWLLHNPEFKKELLKRDSNHKMIIASYTAGLHLWTMDIPDSIKSKIQLVQCGFKLGYASLNWDYGIFGTIFVAPEILRIDFPPKGTLYEVKADDVPLAVVVKRENTYDVDGFQAIQQNNIPLATDYFTKAFQYDPNNFRIWNYYAYILTNQGKLSEAKQYAQQYLELFPDDQLSNQIINAR
ncbi:MAG: tetratricopeptide repeat protein [Alphaproteobacteria bacterium]|nr:tetratricopeptide repeat protein [Alphaproteobacteria bacterium]